MILALDNPIAIALGEDLDSAQDGISLLIIFNGTLNVECTVLPRVNSVAALPLEAVARMSLLLSRT